MATIKEVKEQIQSANALGVANLTEKGVDIPESATTYEIMQGIANVKGGGSDISVEYIESSGTQWIDTGIIPTNHRVKTKMQLVKVPDSLVAYGLFITHSSDYSKAYGLGYYSNTWYYYAGDRHTTTAFSYNDLLEIDFNNDNNEFVVNGQVIGTMNGICNTTFNLPILARTLANSSTIDGDTCSYARLYYFQIYNKTTNELVRDFIPAVDEKGIICLYDKVTETYFYNQGSGEFQGRLIEKGLEEIEDLIDNSGVLEDTEGSVTEKVEELISITNTTSQAKSISFMNNTTVEHIALNCKNLTSLARGFYGCSNLKTVLLSNTQNVTDWIYAFLVSSNIITIETIDLTNATGSIGGYWLPGSVVNLKFVPQSIKRSMLASGCSKLSAESIQSIAYGIAYVTTAQTLTLNKVFENDFEKLPAELRDLITNQKGWTLAFA